MVNTSINLIAFVENCMRGNSLLRNKKQHMHIKIGFIYFNTLAIKLFKAVQSLLVSWAAYILPLGHAHQWYRWQEP